MALNFPNNPSNNDTYTSNGITWQFDGTAWNVIPSASLDYPNTFGSVAIQGGGSLSSNISSDTLNITPGNNISISANDATNTLTISSNVSDIFSFNIAADDSTQQVISSGETVQFIGGAGIDTTSDAEGNITITSTAASASFGGLTDAQTASITIDKIYHQAITRFSLDNDGVAAYTFGPHYTANNPNVYLISGTTVAFDLEAIPGHPFEIQSPTGDPYNTGLVHVATNGTISLGADAQGKDSGTLYWQIPENISGTYRYECQAHASMFGVFSIKRLSLI